MTLDTTRHIWKAGISRERIKMHWQLLMLSSYNHILKFTISNQAAGKLYCPTVPELCYCNLAQKTNKNISTWKAFLNIFFLSDFIRFRWRGEWKTTYLIQFRWKPFDNCNCLASSRKLKPFHGEWLEINNSWKFGYRSGRSRSPRSDRNLLAKARHLRIIRERIDLLTRMIVVSSNKMKVRII